MSLHSAQLIMQWIDQTYLLQMQWVRFWLSQNLMNCIVSNLFIIHKQSPRPLLCQNKMSVFTVQKCVRVIVCVCGSLNVCARACTCVCMRRDYVFWCVCACVCVCHGIFACARPEFVIDRITKIREIDIYTYIYIRIHVYIHICMYIYIHWRSFLIFLLVFQ